MKSKKISILRIFILLIFIFAILFIIIFETISRYFLLFSFSSDFINSGNSFFIPSLPYINVFWFLPENYKFIRFSLGNLIDIVIIFNLYCYIDTCIYHYYKNAYLNDENQVLIDFYSYISNDKEIYTSKELFFPNQSNFFFNSTCQKIINTIFISLKQSTCLDHNKECIQSNFSPFFQIKRFFILYDPKFFPISPKNKCIRIFSFLLFFYQIFRNINLLFFVIYPINCQNFTYYENPVNILNSCKKFQITKNKINNFDRTKKFNANLWQGDADVLIFTGMRIYPNAQIRLIAEQKGVISTGENLLKPKFYISPKIKDVELFNLVREYCESNRRWMFPGIGVNPPKGFAELSQIQFALY